MLSQDDRILVLKSMPFLNKIEKSDLESIESEIYQADYEKGGLIVSKDRKCSGLIIVKAGQIRAFIENEDGKEHTLFRLLPGDICILSASCIMKNISFEISFEAEKNSKLLFLSASIWEKLGDKYGFVKEFSISLMSKRFSEVINILENIMSQNMRQRLSGFLLEQSNLGGSSVLTITHETIAKNLGTAREVVSRVLKEFEHEGTIRLLRGQIEILKPDQLRHPGR